MYNLLIAIGAGIAAFLVFWAPGLLNPFGALPLALVAAVATYALLARRSMRQLEAIMMDAQKEIMAARQGNSLNKQRLDAGLARIKDGFALAKWQFLVEGQVHAQLGMLLFMLERTDEAKPHLEKSLVRIGQARAMLAVLHFKDGNKAAMTKAFEEAVTGDKKNSLVWSTYAYCLEKLGDKQKALDVLARGIQENDKDERLKTNQKALQNNERLKMSQYGQEWYAFRLEQPSMDFIPPGMRPQPGFRKGYRQPPKQR